MYKYVVAIKEYDTDIYMEMVSFDNPQDWKTIYLSVVGDDFWGEHKGHKKWIEDMPKHLHDAIVELGEHNIEISILGV